MSMVVFLCLCSTWSGTSYSVIKQKFSYNNFCACPDNSVGTPHNIILPSLSNNTGTETGSYELSDFVLLYFSLFLLYIILKK